MGRRENTASLATDPVQILSKSHKQEGLLLMILFMKSVRSYLLEREYLSDERAFVFTVLRNDPSASLTGLGHQISLCEYN
jgi:hypothetical protein